MNKSILIVDNEPGVLNGLRRILHNICHVDTALSATIALEKIKQNKTPYAVIITDLMMPGIDGLEFLKQLETIDTHSIKIMLTSSDSQQSTINAINQGKVYKFLRKPCQPETLFDVINTSIIEFQKKSDVENQGNLKDEIKKLTTHLNFHYHHDSLTGLLNRSTFITQLSQTLQQQEEQQSWLCYIDMDFFHLINEAVGNVGGDELLRQISQLLSQLTPDNNLIARLNGNAFALLLKEMASEQSQALVNKIHATLNQHVFIWNYKEIQVSASLGVIPIESNDNSVHAVLNRAENACKVAKQAGRHRVHFGDYQDKLLSEKFNDAIGLITLTIRLKTIIFVCFNNRSYQSINIAIRENTTKYYLGMSTKIKSSPNRVHFSMPLNAIKYHRKSINGSSAIMLAGLLITLNT